MPRTGNDFVMGLGQQTTAAPGDPFELRGESAKDFFLERLCLVSDVTGEVTRVRFANQNVMVSDGSIPIGALSPTYLADAAATIGLPLGASLDVVVNGTLDAAGRVGGYIGVRTWDVEMEGPAEPMYASDYHQLFGLGRVTLGGAGAFTLTAKAKQNVPLGNLLLISGVAGEVTSIEVGSEEMLGSEESVLLEFFGPLNSDIDGLDLNTTIRAGQSVTISGNLFGAGTVGGLIFVEDTNPEPAEMLAESLEAEAA